MSVAPKTIGWDSDGTEVTVSNGSIRVYGISVLSFVQVIITFQNFSKTKTYLQVISSNTGDIDINIPWIADEGLVINFNSGGSLGSVYFSQIGI